MPEFQRYCRHYDIPALLLLRGSASAKGAERLGGWAVPKSSKMAWATFECVTHDFGGIRYLRLLDTRLEFAMLTRFCDRPLPRNGQEGLMASDWVPVSCSLVLCCGLAGTAHL